MTSATKSHMRQHMQQVRQCIVCMHNVADIVYTTCNHIVTCSDCASNIFIYERLAGRNPKCPLCRGPGHTASVQEASLIIG